MPLTDAQRSRRRRVRAQAGVDIARVPVKDQGDITNVLVEFGRLTVRQADCPEMIWAAMGKVVEEWSKFVTRVGRDPFSRSKLAESDESKECSKLCATDTVGDRYRGSDQSQQR